MHRLRSMNVNISIPIHLKYHKAAEKDKFVPVSLSPPTILVKCNHGKCIIMQMNLKNCFRYCFLCSEEPMIVQCVPKEYILRSAWRIYIFWIWGIKRVNTNLKHNDFLGWNLTLQLWRDLTTFIIIPVILFLHSVLQEWKILQCSVQVKWSRLLVVKENHPDTATGSHLLKLMRYFSRIISIISITIIIFKMRRTCVFAWGYGLLFISPFFPIQWLTCLYMYMLARVPVI